MTGGFDANVPARKPRTKIARVISDLTSGPQDGAEGGGDRVVVEDAAPAARDTVADSRGDSRGDSQADYQANRPPDAAVVANHSVARVAGPSAVPPTGTSTAASPTPGGREQIARLRERLAAAAHPLSGAAEPKRTAAAVREMVDGLRDRIEASVRERSELTEALEEARATLAHTGTDLQKERRAREALEAQAEERRRIADDAVAEAEALAAERDQVLGELTELRRMEGEQTSLLTEVEAALAQRDAERESAARELAEARDLVDLRAAEVADLEARLRDEAAGRARAEAKCRQLEAEIARLSEARQALESIETMLGYRRENQDDDTR
jgi:DNA repair exonuclease SbcCD ATPase subunit